ncbi:hypothetical protein [sulfur-oxidizing endosymbiont of Gigantopelta aegis]|uniref:hypothetical protein n=1 Tax=sulfur-oxidizing endosymbiont of Gigantopelta aegis TaxID=2794934 RepID=UPI0018DE79D5|nr:hypothetical protein [sulfur-oxidizing endosymbiont of Gigantopelta aegis]
MISFKELNEQNHKIVERSKIILYMIQDRTICDSDVTCDLFFDLTDRIKKHMDIEERELYKNMLTHSDHGIKQTAENFLSGSAEIKRVLKQYMKRWCHSHHLRIKDHDQFVSETEEIFEMIQVRIINETEKFYPAVRSVYGEKMVA